MFPISLKAECTHPQEKPFVTFESDHYVKKGPQSGCIVQQLRNTEAQVLQLLCIFFDRIRGGAINREEHIRPQCHSNYM